MIFSTQLLKNDLSVIIGINEQDLFHNGDLSSPSLAGGRQSIPVVFAAELAKGRISIRGIEFCKTAAVKTARALVHGGLLSTESLGKMN